MRQERLECHYLHFRDVRSVVDNYIDWWYFALELVPEISAGLISGEDFYAVSLIHPSGGFNVDAVDFALISEIVAPHIKAATTIDADFDNSNRFPTEAV